MNKRDSLQKFLIKNDIDAKVHYQFQYISKKYKFLKYKKGDFPVSEKLAKTSLSLPVHEFINKKHVAHVVNTINKFYKL